MRDSRTSLIRYARETKNAVIWQQRPAALDNKPYYTNTVYNFCIRADIDSSLWQTLVRSRKLLAKSSDMGEKEKRREKASK